ncbi:MAG: carbohydrate ABC transporter permease, partial [Oscillospiraceae bacterium]|nr:carbohydrate ABC transporter permease [Oscillospiraceae bacterium]
MKAAAKNKIKRTRQDIIFDVVCTTILSLLCLLVLYPLYFIVIASFSSPDMINRGEVFLLPRGITWDGYQKIFSYTQLWIGYRNTIVYTLLGTALNVVLTMLTAFPMSRPKFYGRKIFLFYMMFTMYFSGGLIPAYLINQRLGLVNNWLIMVIRGAVSVSNVIICISFMKSS